MGPSDPRRDAVGRHMTSTAAINGIGWPGWSVSLLMVLIFTACASSDSEGTGNADPTSITIAPERPVCEVADQPLATEGFGAFYLCGAITKPLFPSPDRYENLQAALTAIITGSPGVDEGLSTGWDRISNEERAQLTVDFTIEGSEATVSVRRSGQRFVPEGMSQDFDYFMELMMPIRWTVFQDQNVAVLNEPLCYPVEASGAACEMKRTDFVSNFIPDLAGGDPDCYPWRFWVESRCHQES